MALWQPRHPVADYGRHEPDTGIMDTVADP